MKKVAAAVVVMGALGFAGTAAAGNLASHVFTWSGNVPAASTQNGFIIKASDTSDIKNGTLVFTTDTTGKGILQSASTLDFNVFDYKDGANVGAAAASYDYEMTNLAATKDGSVTEQFGNGYYKVVADGSDLVKNDPVTSKSGPTLLTVAADTGTENQPSAGESIAVQATIVITNAIAAPSPSL